jgi:hypothetical protein
MNLFLNSFYRNNRFMKKFLTFFLSIIIISCTQQSQQKEEAKSPAIQGTWKLLTGTIIEKGDTTITEYTKDKSFIKIINESHFAFLQHTLRKDTMDFSAGGGHYELNGDKYTEHLEYCNAKEWEGHDFSFTVAINGDTLIQQGVEKIEAQGIERMNIEKYVRVKNRVQ